MVGRWGGSTGIRVLAAVVRGAGWLTAGGAVAAVPPYKDPSQPVPVRVADLLGRMSLDEKLGQMTQAERLAVSGTDITANQLGSLLSGGGSAPSPNTPSAWADMYDKLQRNPLATPLRIPRIYGGDALHRHKQHFRATP